MTKHAIDVVVPVLVLNPGALVRSPCTSEQRCSCMSLFNVESSEMQVPKLLLVLWRHLLGETLISLCGPRCATEVEKAPRLVLGCDREESSLVP